MISSARWCVNDDKIEQTRKASAISTYEKFKSAYLHQVTREIM